jgi:hypothetical protein
MGKKAPAVALLWMYRGKNAEARREQIQGWNHPGLEILEADPKRGWSTAIHAIPKETGICIFWMDDDKPVDGDFLRQMTQPLIAGEDFGAAMHFWSGNAVSVMKYVLDASHIKDDPAEHSLLKLIVPMLDVADKGPGGRVHLALSSTERLAPMSMEPVGFPS